MVWRVGYNFTQNWGIEAFGSYTQTQIQDTRYWEPWQDIQTYGIEAVPFMPEGRFVPFIAIGFGGIFTVKAILIEILLTVITLNKVNILLITAPA